MKKWKEGWLDVDSLTHPSRFRAMSQERDALFEKMDNETDSNKKVEYWIQAATIFRDQLKMIVQEKRAGNIMTIREGDDVFRIVRKPR